MKVLEKNTNHKYNRDMKKNRRGEVEGSTIVIILLSIALVGIGAFGVWAFINYREAQSNIDNKIELAEAAAKKKEAEDQAEKYAQREKNPNLVFSGPADLGSVSFSYPKTWSSYVASNGAEGANYYAFFHPTTVPPVLSTDDNSKVSQRFALRVAIYNSSLENVLSEYQKTIDKGELSSSSVLANGKNATKLEGLFPNNKNKNDRIQGVAYFFKVNDKVLMLKTDGGATFRADFDKIVNTINFK